MLKFYWEIQFKDIMDEREREVRQGRRKSKCKVACSKADITLQQYTTGCLVTQDVCHIGCKQCEILYLGIVLKEGRKQNYLLMIAHIH